MAAPPTRIISFLQMVQEADPNWNRSRLRPWVYQFSSGRLFYDNPNPYGESGGGFFLETESGDVIQAESGGGLQAG